MEQQKQEPKMHTRVQRLSPLPQRPRFQEPKMQTLVQRLSPRPQRQRFQEPKMQTLVQRTFSTTTESHNDINMSSASGSTAKANMSSASGSTAKANESSASGSSFKPFLDGPSGFHRMPQDYWTRDGDYVIRHHKIARRILFTPNCALDCPAEVSRLTGERITEITYVSQEVRSADPGGRLDQSHFSQLRPRKPLDWRHQVPPWSDCAAFCLVDYDGYGARGQWIGPGVVSELQRGCVSRSLARRAEEGGTALLPSHSGGVLHEERTSSHYTGKCVWHG